MSLPTVNRSMHEPLYVGKTRTCPPFRSQLLELQRVAIAELHLVWLKRIKHAKHVMPHENKKTVHGISWSHLLLTTGQMVIIAWYLSDHIYIYILLYSAECHGASAYPRLRRALVSGQVVKVPDKVLGRIRGTFRLAFPSMTSVFEWPLVTPSCPKRSNLFKPNVMSSSIPTR